MLHFVNYLQCFNWINSFLKGPVYFKTISSLTYSWHDSLGIGYQFNNTLGDGTPGVERKNDTLYHSSKCLFDLVKQTRRFYKSSHQGNDLNLASSFNYLPLDKVQILLHNEIEDRLHFFVVYLQLAILWLLELGLPISCLGLSHSIINLLGTFMVVMLWLQSK